MKLISKSGSQKVNVTKSTSEQFGTNLFSRVAVCGSLHETGANVTWMVQLKERLEVP